MYRHVDLEHETQEYVMVSLPFMGCVPLFVGNLPSSSYVLVFVIVWLDFPLCVVTSSSFLHIFFPYIYHEILYIQLHYFHATCLYIYINFILIFLQISFLNSHLQPFTFCMLLFCFSSSHACPTAAWLCYLLTELVEALLVFSCFR